MWDVNVWNVLQLDKHSEQVLFDLSSVLPLFFWGVYCEKCHQNVEIRGHNKCSTASSYKQNCKQNPWSSWSLDISKWLCEHCKAWSQENMAVFCLPGNIRMDFSSQKHHSLPSFKIEKAFPGSLVHSAIRKFAYLLTISHLVTIKNKNAGSEKLILEIHWKIKK